MSKLVEKSIGVAFCILFFLVPLVLTPYTSELFEFNKMVLTYSLTTTITTLWIVRIIIHKKFIFRRTVLDFPLIIFLFFQIVSTLISVDTRTSFFGYYSRFHGGLLSTISYSILYWAYVSNIDKRAVHKTIYFLLASALLVSIYGILEHFGIDKEVWVQDVQNRVFSTLGQPNWLAAWLVALIPIAWMLAIVQGLKKGLLWVVLSAIFFLTLLFTKSRSGLIGFIVSDIVFWAFALLIIIRKKKNKIKAFTISFLSVHLIIFSFSATTGTPWTPSIKNFIEKNETAVTTTTSDKQEAYQAPALEVGGTASGEIRKIVWKGALDIFKAYPILGTGVETFAFSYYSFRPVEHNLVSEWDFLYNKAHNEYLNFLATTGVFGTGTYLLLIAVIILSLSVPVFIGKPKTKLPRIFSYYSETDLSFDSKMFNVALLSGFTSILVTNFFGFSVVPVGIQFFLYPAIAVSLTNASNEKEREIRFDPTLKTLVVIVGLVTVFIQYKIARYWYVDHVYAQGKAYGDAHKPVQAREKLLIATRMSPGEAIYWDELSQASADISVALNENGQGEIAQQLANSAANEANMALRLSAANINIKRNAASTFIKLSSIYPNHMLTARQILDDAVIKAPTEAKLFYNLGLIYARTGNNDVAKEILEKTVQMKPNYRHAHFALAILYIDMEDKEKAKEELEYILRYIDPNDTEAKRQLDEISSI